MKHTNVWEAAVARNVTLEERQAFLEQQQYMLLHDGSWHLVVQVAKDQRRFRVFPGWVQIVEGENGGVTTAYTIVDSRFRQDEIPTVIKLLADVLRRQFYRTQRTEVVTQRAMQLRWLAVFVEQAGWRRTPDSWHVMRGGCAMYWSCPREWQRWMTQAQWDRLAAFAERYRRFCRYWMEQAPRWTPVQEINYGDNSTEVIEVSAHSGAMRRRMTRGPGGDRCF